MIIPTRKYLTLGRILEIYSRIIFQVITRDHQTILLSKRIDMANKIIILVILVFWSFVITGQELENIRAQVIAESGLNLRSKPSLQSSVILKIPYYQSIHVYNKTGYRDTIQVFETDTYPIHVDGEWVKVSYQNKTGYVLSTYLNVPSKQFQDPNLNQDFILLFPGVTCRDNIHKKIDHYWYGLYQNKDTCYLKPVNFEFVNTIPEMYSNEQILIRERKDLKFIVGSKTPLTTGTISSKHENYFERIHMNEEYSFCDSTYTLGDGLFLKTEMNDRDQCQKNYFFKLDSKTYPFKCQIKHCSDFYSGLIWRGDLNNDGVDDFIWSFGDKFSPHILYMSCPESKSDEIMAPVAAFYTGYCC